MTRLTAGRNGLEIDASAFPSVGPFAFSTHDCRDPPSPRLSHDWLLNSLIPRPKPGSQRFPMGSPFAKFSTPLPTKWPRSSGVGRPGAFNSLVLRPDSGLRPSSRVLRPAASDSMPGRHPDSHGSRPTSSTPRTRRRWSSCTEQWAGGAGSTSVVTPRSQWTTVHGGTGN